MTDQNLTADHMSKSSRKYRSTLKKVRICNIECNNSTNIPKQ